jgi:L-Ala-D/L-Glu epimerase
VHNLGGRSLNIVAVRASEHRLALANPYVTSYGTIADVTIFLVEIEAEDGRVGLGAASPATYITGETVAATRAACAADALSWLLGQDIFLLPRLCRLAGSHMARQPAARTAVDGALYDLWAQAQGRPLVQLLGQVHAALPTAITIGIKSSEESLDEIDRRRAQGFRIIKVKVGRSVEEDADRLRRIRAHVGAGVPLIADPNTGYTDAALRRFADATQELELEFYEQPTRADARALRQRPENPALATAPTIRLAADEALIGPQDALILAAPPAACQVMNIKLMKCGGLSAAAQIATVADIAGLDLMWGCMDESRVSIAAALHLALACPRTRYLDLDGCFDLAADVAEGGFRFEDGLMAPLDAPGLGLRRITA